MARIKKETVETIAKRIVGEIEEPDQLWRDLFDIEEYHLTEDEENAYLCGVDIDLWDD